MTNSFVILARVSGTTDSLVKAIKSISQKPLNGVKVIGTWTTFGAYDACVVINAESDQAAMDFVSNHIRPIQNLLTTETLVGVPQATYTPSSVN
jgi:uncharacterized protein with GYD domain